MAGDKKRVKKLLKKMGAPTAPKKITVPSKPKKSPKSGRQRKYG